MNTNLHESEAAPGNGMIPVLERKIIRADSCSFAAVFLFRR
ncbi:MAG TPA: hypothetical protein VNQ79_17665 [Blastocatellia bacterium]|nr:hypothetical protein [Blastocatellia bacterium]